MRFRIHESPKGAAEHRQGWNEMEPLLYIAMVGRVPKVRQIRFCHPVGVYDALHKLQGYATLHPCL